MIDQPQKNNAKDLTELINHNHHNPVLHQSPMTTTARTSPRPSSSSTAASSQVKTKKAWAKSADWTEDERYSLLEAWGPKFSKLRIASQKEKIRIWNEIYSTYKHSNPDSQRPLPNVKKRLQNLEYKFKLLKQRSRSTGEAQELKVSKTVSHF